MGQRFPKRGLYNVSAAWRLPRGISLAALRRAAERLGARHPTWRATFSEREGVPFQTVHEYLLPDFREVHVADTLGTDFRKLLDAEASRPFDFEQGPLARWVLFFSERYDPVLLLVVHHTIVDGWSISTLLPELGKLYRAESGGPQMEPPLPARSYAQFIQEQSDWLASPAGGRQKAFWKERLSENILPLDLPTDRPRRSDPSFDSDCILFPIPPNLRKKARALAKHAGVRPLAVWLSACFVLLHRLSGQETLVTSIPVAGRKKTYDGVLGFFVNILPIRLHCSGQERFRSFLLQTANTLESALAHRDWPFQLMTQDVSRDTLSALLENTFSWQNYNNLGERDAPLVTRFEDVGDIWHVGGMDWELVRLPQQRDQTDIQIQLINLPDSQYGALQYSSDLFDRSTAERWIGYFMQLLQGIVADPETPIAELSLLTETERHRILVEWNDTASPYPQNKCIHELFQEQAINTPDAVAVIFENEKISYGELNIRANRLAHRLRGMGVGPEALVGLFVERSVEMIVGLLGILKAGGAYVPLDPEYPKDRLAFMSDDARLAVLLCHGATRNRLPKCAARILDVDAEAAAIAGESSGNLAPLATPNNLAYVIYTSGSTGKPKGVMVEHRGLTNLAWAQTGTFRVTPEDRVLQFASLNFDASLEQIFSTLLGGAGLVLRGREIWTVEECWHEVHRNNVTIANLPPVYLHQLLEFCLKNKTPSSRFPIRQFVAGGEALGAAAAGLCRELGVPLVNAYGPTEATITATIFHLSHDENIATVPIGSPIPNTRAYILDHYRRPIPIGVGGELYIGGAGVARGYLNRPDLTAERFIPDPFSDDPDARLYRTGDLCRWLPDGAIEFLGRIDTQVKIRGFRIECGEVENALLSDSSIRQAVVDARGEGMDKRLVAWIVLADGYGALQLGLPAYLRAILREHLPDWMLPSALLFVDALPLTPSGKIDRRALPDPDVDAGVDELGARAKYVPARNSTEENLRAIFADVLDAGRVGIHDDFFELGGHSLLATKVIAMARERLRVELPLRALFQYPTPVGLSAAIEADEKWRPTILVPLKIGGAQPPLFCVHPVGGGAFRYRELADCLPRDLPVYGIQAVGFEGNEPPLTDIEAMATRYVQEITTLWQGPYNLYGWSFGGLVAFEMAGLLRAAGREVSLLALADTGHPSRFQGEKEPEEDEIMAHLLAEAESIPFREIGNMTLAARRTRLRRQVAARSNPSESQLDHFIDIYRINRRALSTCRLSPWPEDMLFLSAKEPLDPDDEPIHLPWRGLARNIHHHVIPGNHFTLHRQPNVDEIARILAEHPRGRK